MTLRILHLEDDPLDAELVKEVLKAEGINSEIVCTAVREEFISELMTGSYDLILADFSVPSYDGLSALKLTRQHHPYLPFILISGTVGEEVAVEALKSGATDYVLKGRLYRLPIAIRRALRESQERYERMQTEEALRQSEGRFRAISEDSPLGIFVTDENGNMIYINRRAQEITGFHPEDNLDQRWSDLIHPEDRERVTTDWKELLKHPAAAESVHRYVRDENSVVWVRTKIAMLNDRQRFLGFVGVVEDITDNVRKDEELRSAEMKYRNLVEKAPAVVYMAEIGPKGRWLYVSPQIQRILGHTQEEFQTDPGTWYRLIHPDDCKRVQAEESRCQETGEAFVSEYRMIARDGSVVWLRDEATVVANQSLIQGVLTDVTRLKQAEEEKARLEKQYLHSQKMEAVGQLAGGMAHDFNNLLMAISGYCELLLLTTPNLNQSAEFVKEIQKAVDRGSSLIRQLLTFARNQKVEMRILDLNDVIRQMQAMLQRLLGADIELRTDLEEPLAHIKADYVQIEQVIMNLAVNARDAMPKGGRLEIRTANQAATDESAPMVVLSISDSGVGMDEETQAKLFEPFYTTKPKGTGLGLSTVYGIVKQSGGHIQVRSRMGCTEFTITFPAARKSRAGIALPEFAVTGEQKSPNETILFVDDNESVLKPLSSLLESVGYHVLSADSGKAAMEMATPQLDRIDLLITDVVMPGMTGRELARHLRSLRPELKILFLTGFSPDTVADPLEPGAVLLQKPVTMNVLLQSVRQLLD